MASTQADMALLQAASEREVDVVAAGNVQGYWDLLDDDAVMMPPNAPAKTGAELRSWLRDFLQSATVEWLDFTHGPWFVSGDLASHDYAYLWRVTPRNGTPGIVARGKGIQLYRRNAAGQWKLLRELWNATPA